MQTEREALRALLSLVRRDAPHLSGKVVGDAEAALASAPPAEPAGEVYTMEALVPGGGVKHHVTLHKPLPAGTKLYAAPVSHVQAQRASEHPWTGRVIEINYETSRFTVRYEGIPPEIGTEMGGANG